MAALYQNTDLASLLVGMVKSPSSIQDAKVTGLSLDSRQCEADFLFIALAKEQSQRFSHIQQAVLAGATVVLFDSEQVLTVDEQALFAESTDQVIAVSQLATKTGEIAARFYGHPSLALTVIAITGTNGKTSVSQFIAQALESIGLPCGVIGTLGVGTVDNLQSVGMTTPDPVTLQATLADFCYQSINYVVIEASSHALDQGRLNSVAIDVAVLTNLSRDHLDYHQDMAEYIAAKKRLFDFSSIKTAVINNADGFGQTLITDLKNRTDVSVFTYSSQSTATLYAIDIDSLVDGLTFKLVNDSQLVEIDSSLMGRFNVDNLLATASSLLAVGISFDDVMKSIQCCHCVDGRMEIYGEVQQAHVVVDFAHTPDALTQVLTSLRLHVPVNGKLWCVFGCGGDRDSGKRPLMGRSAELYADNIVLTDDNPRNENSREIIDGILSGMENSENIHIEPNRKLAITHAISVSNPNDIVLVAGKGHEKYQEIAGVKHPFNDAKVVIKALQAANDESQLTMSAN